MIWQNSVTSFIYTLLSSDSILVNSSITVELNEQFNRDINKTPWVGVYGGEIAVLPHRAQITQPWIITFEIPIYVQGASFDNGQEAADILDRTLTPVLTAINSNRALGSTVDLIREWEITPFDRDIDDNNYFYTDELLLRAEVRG